MAISPRTGRMFRTLRWLYPGMRVKRWIAVIFLGVLLSSFGAVAIILGIFERDVASASSWYGLGGLAFLLSGAALLIGVYRLTKSLGELLGRRTDRAKNLVDIAFRQRYLGLGPRVVAIGGGTGLSRLLTGLREYTSQITAVVSVADDGGSSGRLRREFDMLPPGDIRKCLIALSEESSYLGELLQYRFQESDLKGHSFGNLLLTVLTQLTGDFSEAVRQAGRLLSIGGRVIPATLDRVSLVAAHEDGSRTVGQRRISESHKRVKHLELEPVPPPASREIIEAIESAELIVVGPGSLYTSVQPNLLIDGIPEALRSSSALKVYVANVAAVEGETAEFSLRDHLEAFVEQVGYVPFDTVLVNSGSVPTGLLRRLATTGGKMISYEAREFERNGYDVRFVQADIVSQENIVWHDPRKLARALMGLLAAEREETG